MKKLPNFMERLLSLNLSSLLVALLALISFFVGFYFTELPTWFEQVQNERERFLIISFIVGIPLTLFKFTDLVISEEMQLATRSVRKEERRGVEFHFQEVNVAINGNISKIQAPETTETITVEKIVDILNQLAQEVEKFQERYRAAIAISEWLDEVVDGKPYGNRHKLLATALNSVFISDGRVQQVFKNDILECIHWLHDSLINPQLCLVEKCRYASALCKGHLEARTYVMALNVIKDYLKREESFKSLSHKDDVLDEFLGHLIEGIQKISLDELLLTDS
ncbi:MAG: hypothetical protein F6K30_14735 [Cyanothece sp. SIO2G6]|nr:hypothetical protein [Cyanothece sp. SIO2G6]